MEEDLRNLPKPGLVFSATEFITTDDWHEQEEAAIWDDCVLVSFQENLWVEITTYQRHLR